MRNNDAVVEKQHPLEEEEGSAGVSLSPGSTFCICAGRSHEFSRAQLEGRGQEVAGGEELTLTMSLMRENLNIQSRVMLSFSRMS